MRVILGELDLWNRPQAGQEKTKPRPRIASYPKLRNVASQPAMHAQHSQLVSSKARLRHQGSRLDLLDQRKLTSFPSLSYTGDGPLNMIEDYFPDSPEVLSRPCNPHTCNSWAIVMQKKLRWRWRLQGLVH